METLNVRASSVTPILLRALKVNRPIFIWGAPGIGKSELVEGIVQSGELGNAVTIDLRLALLEPTDLRGYPFRNPETNTMEWSPPSDLPSEEFASNYDSVVLFLDELNSAPPSVQAAAYQLVLNRRIGQYTLPKNVKIIAAGNRETDRGVTYRMPAPLANRFRHINMDINFDDWQQWAVNNSVHPDVVGYLTYSKGDLFDFDAKSSSQSFATPRSWSFVSEVIDDKMDATQMTDIIAGSVGEGLAVKFQAHRKIAGKLPNPSDILAGKVKSTKTKEISAMYTLITSMCYELKNECEKAQKSKSMSAWHKMADNFIQFMMDNFETEMVVLGARTALKTYQLPFSPKNLKSFDEFYKRYGSLIVEA